MSESIYSKYDRSLVKTSNFHIVNFNNYHCYCKINPFLEESGF